MNDVPFGGYNGYGTDEHGVEKTIDDVESDAYEGGNEAEEYGFDNPDVEALGEELDAMSDKEFREWALEELEELEKDNEELGRITEEQKNLLTAIGKRTAILVERCTKKSQSAQENSETKKIEASDLKEVEKTSIGVGDLAKQNIGATAMTTYVDSQGLVHDNPEDAVENDRTR